MRLCLDACVLYPTVLREILIGAAQMGLFMPIWSARILEEWARAAARGGPDDEMIARGEIALLRARFAEAEVPADAALTDSLWLPDADDRHVLAAAITGKAEGIVTLNTRDFPSRSLAEFQLTRWHPDDLLLRLMGPPLVQIVEAVHQKAEASSGQDLHIRGLMKRAKLPKLGKALIADAAD